MFSIETQPYILCLKGFFKLSKLTSICLCKWLKNKYLNINVMYYEIKIDEQPEKIDYVKSLGFTAAPVIEAGDIVFSGFQPAKLKEIL